MEANKTLQLFVRLMALIYAVTCHIPSTAWASVEPVNHITCGSVIKLKNEAKPKFRLHSHDVKYGSGSGQQSVTGAENQDTNSYWNILAPKDQQCNRGEPIKCGTVLRLQHIQTRKHLHSHHFKSPLSSQQEVSAFGSDGETDTGDHWQVECKTKYWNKGDSVRLRHVDTNMWLSLSGNTYGRPIFGQLEVVCSQDPDSTSYWQSVEGVYVQPSKTSPQNAHDEL